MSRLLKTYLRYVWQRISTQSRQVAEETGTGILFKFVRTEGEAFQAAKEALISLSSQLPRYQEYRCLSMKAGVGAMGSNACVDQNSMSANTVGKDVRVFMHEVQSNT